MPWATQIHDLPICGIWFFLVAFGGTSIEKTKSKRYTTHLLDTWFSCKKRGIDKIHCRPLGEGLTGSSYKSCGIREIQKSTTQLLTPHKPRGPSQVLYSWASAETSWSNLHLFDPKQNLSAGLCRSTFKLSQTYLHDGKRKRIHSLSMLQVTPRPWFRLAS